MSERNHYFTYSASASAFGGVITQPSPLVIPSEAMASISPSGGYGSATVSNFGMPGLISVGKATTTVQGDGKRSEVTVTIEGVDVMGVLTVSRMVLHMTSQVVPGGREASISPEGTVIEGVAIQGRELSLHSSVDVFAKNPAYSALEKAYVAGGLNGLIIKPGTLDGKPDAPTLDGNTTAVGDVRGAIYDLANNLGGWPAVYGGLRVKDFATIYLGEYRISRYARRLTLLRLELGCGTDGSISLGDGAVNGHEEPPAW